MMIKVHFFRDHDKPRRLYANADVFPVIEIDSGTPLYDVVDELLRSACRRKPPRPPAPKHWTETIIQGCSLYSLARKEHAWLLLAEGMSYTQIAVRMGVVPESIRKYVKDYGSRINRAVRRAHFTISVSQRETTND